MLVCIADGPILGGGGGSATAVVLEGSEIGGGSGKAVSSLGASAAWTGGAVAGSCGAERRDFGGLSVRLCCCLLSLDAPAIQVLGSEVSVTLLTRLGCFHHILS